MKGIPASRFRRFLAYIVDILIIFAVSFLLSFLYFLLFPQEIGKFEGSEHNRIMTGSIALSFVGTLLYFTISEQSSWQATLGKKWLGLYVADSNNKRISFAKSSIRYLLYSVAFAPYYLYNCFFSQENNEAISMPLTVIILSIILQLIWFGPILLKDRKGAHDRLSRTFVYSRKK